MTTEKLKEILDALSLSRKLPNALDFTTLIKRTIRTLETESESYRPRGKNKRTGGLLDWTNQEELPTLIIPDLHARTRFLRDILDFVPDVSFLPRETGEPLTIFEALRLGKVRVISLGDILHSEARGYTRWLFSLMEMLNGNIENEGMIGEMSEGLSLEMMLMILKCAFPKHFHILKGNHENILNETGNGNYAFYKFAREGEMVRLFMERVYGKELLFSLAKFEKSLPLVALLPNLVASHSEPQVSFSREEIINSLDNDEIIKNFTWTGNGEAVEGSVELMIKKLLKGTEKTARYVGGHRPISGKFATRQGSLYVQIHNPDAENVALIRPGLAFIPEEDIVSVT